MKPTSYPSEPAIDATVEDLAQQNVLPPAEDALPEETPATQDAPPETARWDDPPGSTGSRAPAIPLEDETLLAEDLVQSGLDEADEELRELDEDDLDFPEVP